jgi:hypothetical protein
VDEISMATSVARMSNLRDLDLYLTLERLMVHLDQAADPLADRVRDLMDPVWHRLSPDEIALLDSRGKIDPAGLFPVRLPFPAGARLPPTTVSGKRFTETPGWRTPNSDWKKTA